MKISQNENTDNGAEVAAVGAGVVILGLSVAILTDFKPLFH